MKEYLVFVILLVLITGMFSILSKEKEANQWHLKSYQYVITLEDEDWIEVKHADGTIVGHIKCDTTTQLGKLFYKDNE